MQPISGMAPCNQDLKIQDDVVSHSPESNAPTPEESQQSRVMSGAGAASSAAGQPSSAPAGAQESAQQAGADQGKQAKKEGGLEKLFAAIQKGIEQLLSLIPIVGNMLKSLLPKAGGGAAGAGAT